MTISPRDRRTIELAIGLLGCIAAVQLWVLTAGFAGWPTYTNYYSQLADAFLHHQLSLRTLPPPKLLALPDPYDPVANGPLRMHDAILFDGKYYLYWGPAPAIVSALACKILRVAQPDFGDQYLAAALAIGTVAAAAVLLLQIRARYFPEGDVIVPILSLGLGTPILFTLARPAVYEAAIFAGQFFLITGFCAALAGVTPRIRAGWLGVAGVLWALCLASRVSLIFGVGVAAAIVLGQAREEKRIAHCAVRLAVPILASIVLLGCYNETRFHRFTEFGLPWQLSASNQHDRPLSSFMSLRNVPANFFCYLFTRPHLIGRFPFALPADGRPRVANWLNLPLEFRSEGLVGLLWTQPFLLFMLAVKWRRPNESAWLIWSLLAAGALGIFPAMMIRGATMRYLLDAVPCFTIVAAVGYWRILQSRHGRPIKWLGVSLILGQTILALFLAVTGYYDHFKLHDPALYDAMKSFFGS